MEVYQPNYIFLGIVFLVIVFLALLAVYFFVPKIVEKQMRKVELERNPDIAGSLKRLNEIQKEISNCTNPDHLERIAHETQNIQQRYIDNDTICKKTIILLADMNAQLDFISNSKI